MRTTVTLDPDVERMIRDAMKERSISFKEALNAAARTGLSGEKNGPKKHSSRSPFVWEGRRNYHAAGIVQSSVGTAGNLTSDAHLAALAIENGAVFCSSDNDFARFPGLKWMNQLS